MHPSTEKRALNGLACMALAVLFFSFMNVCIKLLGAGIPVQETVFVRSAATIPIVLWMIRRRGLSPLGNSRKFLLLRGTFSTLGMLTYFACVGRLPLGNAILLTQASPIFAAWFAAKFLHERPGRALVIASTLCAIRLTLVARPTADAPIEWSVVALLSCVLNGATYTIVRASSRQDHHLVVVFALPAVAAPVCAALTAFHFVLPDARQWLLLAGVTAASIVAQIFMTMGMQRETAGRATNMFFLGVILNLGWGQLLGDPPIGHALLFGAALILSGVVVVALGKRVAPEPSVE